MREKKPIYELEEIDTIAEEYRDKGTDASAELLIQCHEGLLWKYAHLLKHTPEKSRSVEKDKELSGFIRLFGAKGCNNLFNIRKALHAWEITDVYNQLIVLFYETTRRWIKHEGIHFSGFISGYFRYTVKRWIDTVTHDALNSNDIGNILPDDEVEEKHYEVSDIKFLICSKSPILEDLTNQERYILYLQLINKMSDTKTAKKIGLNRYFVPDVRRTAIEKVKKNYLKQISA